MYFFCQTSGELPWLQHEYSGRLSSRENSNGAISLSTHQTTNGGKVEGTRDSGRRTGVGILEREREEEGKGGGERERERSAYSLLPCGAPGLCILLTSQ